MHSTTILILAVGLLATVAMARPGKRPTPGHHHGGSGNEVVSGQHGRKWSLYHLPDHIRLPHRLTEKLGEGRATFTATKIMGGKYLVISPALIFKLKSAEASTTAFPQTSTASTTEDTSIVETTTPTDEESTTTEPESEESTTAEPELEESTTPEEIDEESTTAEPEEEETTTATPSFFRKRSFSINDNEQLLFLED